MHLPLSLLFFVLASYDTVTPAYAGFSPHRSIARATEKLHKFAKRNSAGLARDIRVAFNGLSTRDVGQNPMQADRVYCVRPDVLANFGGNATATSPAQVNGSVAAGGSIATRTNGFGTGTSLSPGAPKPTSAFSLVQSYVSTSAPCSFHATNNIKSVGAKFLRRLGFLQCCGPD